jgi:hypothetical protein
MKKVLFVLLMLPFLSSCSKKDEKTPAVTEDTNYIINGIHDVDFATTGSNILPLAITLNTGGQQQTVTLSVEDLPDGITASFGPATGIPSFSTLLTFTNNSAKAGTYTIKVIGTTASSKKTYTLKIVVPDVNGFYLNGIPYTFSTLEYKESSSFRYIAINVVDFKSDLYIFLPKEGLPASAGTYTYSFSAEEPLAANTVGLSASTATPNVFYIYSASTGSSVKMTLVIGSDKKIKSIVIPAVDMIDEAKKIVTLSVNIRN